MVPVVFMKISHEANCAFECGIKLGALFHQFIGTPVSLNSKKSLEKAMEESIMNQPYVKEVEVSILPDLFKKIKNPFQYFSLEGKMLRAIVTVQYKNYQCKGQLAYDEKTDYPLMSLIGNEEITQK